MSTPYHSVQMCAQHQIQLPCMCWQQTVPNRYIQVKFDIGYCQWYASIRDSSWELPSLIARRQQSLETRNQVNCDRFQFQRSVLFSSSSFKTYSSKAAKITQDRGNRWKNSHFVSHRNVNFCMMNMAIIIRASVKSQIFKALQWVWDT